MSTKSATAMPGSISSSLAGPVSTNTHCQPWLTSSSILGCGVHFEQLWVLHLSATRPPAGKGLLGVEIKQRHAVAFLSGTNRKSAGEHALANAALQVRQRHHARCQRRFVLCRHLVPTQ